MNEELEARLKELMAADAPVIDAARRHIRSYEPGTLLGSELALALALRDLDGPIWDPWCEPGEMELDKDAS